MSSSRKKELEDLRDEFFKLDKEAQQASLLDLLSAHFVLLDAVIILKEMIGEEVGKLDELEKLGKKPFRASVEAN